MSSKLFDGLAIVAALFVTLVSLVLACAPLILMLALAYWLVKQS